MEKSESPVSSLWMRALSVQKFAAESDAIYRFLREVQASATAYSFPLEAAGFMEKPEIAQKQEK